jgi:hypothetical protein
MNRLAIVALVLLAPSIARADWTATPPKGWVEKLDDALVAQQKAMEEKLPNAQVTVRQWHAPDEAGVLAIQYISMPPGTDTLTIQQFVDATMKYTTKNFEAQGMKRVADTAAHDEHGQMVAQRTIAAGDGRHVTFVIRSQRNAEGGLETMTESCWVLTGSACKKVLVSAKLTKPKTP